MPSACDTVPNSGLNSRVSSTTSASIPRPAATSRFLGRSIWRLRFSAAMMQAGTGIDGQARPGSTPGSVSTAHPRCHRTRLSERNGQRIGVRRNAVGRGCGGVVRWCAHPLPSSPAGHSAARGTRDKGQRWLWGSQAISSARSIAIGTSDRSSDCSCSRGTLLAPLRRVAAEVPARGRILDLGCGHGLFANLLATSAPERDILGVDPSSEKLRVARHSSRGLSNVRYQLGRAEDVQGADSTLSRSWTSSTCCQTIRSWPSSGAATSCWPRAVGCSSKPTTPAPGGSTASCGARKS